MLFDSLGSDGLKSAETDVQGDLDCLDAASANARQDFRSEMQAGGWSGDGSAFVRIDGLIALAVGGGIFPRDVGREGDMSDALEDGEEIFRRNESDVTFPEGSAGDYLGLQFILRAKEEMLSNSDFAAGADETLPFIWLRCDLAGEENLDASAEEFAGGWILRAEGLRVDPLAATVKPSRKDAGVVEDQEVGWAQKIRESTESQVLKSSICNRKTQKAGCGTIRKGNLGDQFRGKIVVKIGDEHALRL